MRFAILLFVLMGCITTKAQYKNIVLEGGGINGTAYAGALAVLSESGKLDQIENILGTSSGSFVGFLLAIGFNATQIDSITQATNIKKFDDRNGWLNKAFSLKKHWGGSPGIYLYKYLHQMAAAQTGIQNLTFAQLDSLTKTNPKYKNLYCVVTNLNNQKTEVLSKLTHPNMPIALAVRASSSIPFYFEPVSINNNYKWIRKKRNEQLTYYVDGGINGNFLMEFFDSCNNQMNTNLDCNLPKANMQTIGLKLERNEQQKAAWADNTQIVGYKIGSFKSYSYSIGNFIMESMNRRYPNIENEKGRTIYIASGNTEPTIRKMSLAEKRKKYEDSRTAAIAFLALNNTTKLN